MTITLLKRAFVTTAATAAVVLFAGGIASAHIDPDPIAMQAGTAATVQFKVEHGCNGSPTTSMKFQIPAGVTHAPPGGKAGWAAAPTGGAVEVTRRAVGADPPNPLRHPLPPPATPPGQKLQGRQNLPR